MSAQYGIWNFDGKPVDLHEFRQTALLLSRYGPDGVSTYLEPSCGLLFASLQTLPDSARETQPQVLPSGAVLVWDGRLDNRSELVGRAAAIEEDSPDVEIVAGLYERHGLAVLAWLIGDWALSIWEPHKRSLILARDFLGTRHLYYRLAKDQVRWCTVLDPLVRPGNVPLTLSGEYLAGCLGSLPAAHLTPYNEIAAVPPASCLVLTNGQVRVKRYWDFDGTRRVHYRSDSEYQAHFLDLFKAAVRRRLRSKGPVLAELSGGMDSSSVVCLADELLAADNAGPDLQTISYFSAFEPDWDEMAYFTRVEQKRGRTGFHVDLGESGFFRFTYEASFSSLAPSIVPRTHADEEIDKIIRKSGCRVVLSGIGGDEFLGGVPSCAPELADLIQAAECAQLARQLKSWALAQKKPWVHLLAAACQDFMPFELRGAAANGPPAHWIRPDFAKRYRRPLAGYPDRIHLLGPRPSFQHARGTVEVLRRSLAWSPLSPSRLCEKRYPYLDRSLLEFLFAIPREQLLRPGARRSLMRRALLGTVPDEILTRKRKAFISRAPLRALKCEWTLLVNEDKPFVAAALGIFDEGLLIEAMRQAREGREVPLIPLVRTLALECWLRHITTRFDTSVMSIGEESLWNSQPEIQTERR
jgi:asparagine synthase (glutamine-hydrolysing)